MATVVLVLFSPARIRPKDKVGTRPKNRAA
jgi:hypothetical protein